LPDIKVAQIGQIDLNNIGDGSGPLGQNDNPIRQSNRFFHAVGDKNCRPVGDAENTGEPVR
jgi:hypothetical protein